MGSGAARGLRCGVGLQALRGGGPDRGGRVGGVGLAFVVLDVERVRLHHRGQILAQLLVHPERVGLRPGLDEVLQFLHLGRGHVVVLRVARGEFAAGGRGAGGVAGAVGRLRTEPCAGEFGHPCRRLRTSTASLADTRDLSVEKTRCKVGVSNNPLLPLSRTVAVMAAPRPHPTCSQPNPRYSPAPRSGTPGSRPTASSSTGSC